MKSIMMNWIWGLPKVSEKREVKRIEKLCSNSWVRVRFGCAVKGEALVLAFKVL